MKKTMMIKKYIKTYQGYKNFIAPIKSFKKMEIDIETYNLQGLSATDPHSSCISTIQFRIKEHLAIIDCMYIDDFDILGEWLEDPDILKLIHNGKFEWNMLKAIKNININNIWCSQKAEQRILNGLVFKGFKYQDVVQRHLDIEINKSEQQSDWGKRPLTNKQLLYCANDVTYIEAVQKSQYQMLRESNQLASFHLDMQLIPVIGQMELNGIRLDINRVKKEQTEFKAKAEKLLLSIQKRLPRVPLTKSDKSKKKMREVYPDLHKAPTSTGDFKAAYGMLGVKLPLNRKTGKPTLSKGNFHNVDHPTAPDLQEYNKTKKLITSYWNKMLGDGKKNKGWTHPITGKVHAEFNQNGTVTGRFAVKNPPLQTIPRLPVFRVIFIPEKVKRYILKFDYSQLELRVAAVKFRSHSMMQAFREDKDVHKITASQIYKVAYDKVTKEQRQYGKNTNFGTIYGQTPFGLVGYLAKVDVFVSFDDAKIFVDSFFKSYPEFKKYHQQIGNETLNALYDYLDNPDEVMQIFEHEVIYERQSRLGRVRYWNPNSIPLVEKTNQYGERYEYTICNEQINYDVQSSANDIVQSAMLSCSRAVEKYSLDAKLCLQVHDELVFDVAKKDLFKSLELIKYKMEQVGKHIFPEVPILVEAKYGQNWGDMTEYEG